MSPRCFVIMPFGHKDDIDGTSIDFDDVYRDLIKPAIEEALHRFERFQFGA